MTVCNLYSPIILTAAVFQITGVLTGLLAAFLAIVTVWLRYGIDSQLFATMTA